MDNWRTPPAPIPDHEIVDRRSADVVVVGLGYAGTTALRAAAESGAKVIAIEQMSEDKYSTWGKDIGHINSKFLASRGLPHVDPIDYFNEWMRRASGRANPGLIMKFCQNCGAAFDWFIDVIENTDYIRVGFWPGGTKFDGEIGGYKFWPGTAMIMGAPPGKPSGPAVVVSPWSEEMGDGEAPPPPPANVGDPDSAPNTTTVCRRNQKKAEALGAEVFFGIEAMQLTMENGRVTGVIGKGEDGKYHLYSAEKYVILAAGGFGGNREMVADLLHDMQDLYREGDGSRQFGMGRSGRGIQLGLWAGGVLEAGEIPTMGGNYNTHRGMNGTFGILWLDPNGKRYCNEVFGDPVLAGMPGNQIKRGNYYNIFDSDIYEDLQWAPPAHESFDCSQPEGREHLEDAMAKALAVGKGGCKVRAPGSMVRIVAGRNMEELLDNAELTGQVRENVRASIERYNELCRKGRDEDFGKDAKLLRPLDKWPLFLQFQKYDNRMMCTVGGLVTDENQQVLDKNFDPIPGLMATGNTCGRRYGPQYSTPTSGVSIALCLTLGREAGKFAAGN